LDGGTSQDSAALRDAQQSCVSSGNHGAASGGQPASARRGPHADRNDAHRPEHQLREACERHGRLQRGPDHGPERPRPGARVDVVAQGR
jgi:hypothetical protein